MCIGDSYGNPIDREKILNKATEFAKRGLRVLAFAYREVSDDIEELTCREVEKM